MNPSLAAAFALPAVMLFALPGTVTLLSLPPERTSVTDTLRNDRAHLPDQMADTLRKINNKAFGTGERLVFDVSYGFITAGEAVMAVPSIDTISGRPCYHVEFEVN